MIIPSFMSLKAVYCYPIKLPAQSTKYLGENEYTVPTLLKVLEHLL